MAGAAAAATIAGVVIIAAGTGTTPGPRATTAGPRALPMIHDKIPPTAPAVTTKRVCTDTVCAVNKVTDDRDIPWGFVPLPDGTVLYSRRGAHDIVLLNPSTGKKSTVGQVPNSYGTDWALGLAVSPTFATDRWLYVFHTTALDSRIVRIKLTTANTLDAKSLRALVVGIPHSKVNNGGRLRFGPDGKLYAGTGDADHGSLAQNPQSLAGKVLRMNPDGGAPSDNPTRSYIWSLGHRNIEGLAFDAKGRLWAVDSGNGIADELNLIQKGGNYGWPYCEATVSRGRGGCATSGFLKPKYTWPAAQCTCGGLAVVGGAIYVAAGRDGWLWRLVIKGASVTHATALLQGRYGWLRTVEPSTDGGLWLTTSNGGQDDGVPHIIGNRIYRVALGLAAE
jgi:glucose/arabinose dehydrogenase